MALRENPLCIIAGRGRTELGFSLPCARRAMRGSTVWLRCVSGCRLSWCRSGKSSTSALRSSCSSIWPEGVERGNFAGSGGRSPDRGSSPGPGCHSCSGAGQRHLAPFTACLWPGARSFLGLVSGDAARAAAPRHRPGIPGASRNAGARRLNHQREARGNPQAGE